jgi:hypothetical protein
MKNLGEDFIWFFGVVEDRADPLELGRVRVRCYGWHTEDKREIPTEDLPWAQPMQPITSGAMGDIGRSPTGLVEGSWVIGFFADGVEAQRPIIMGSIAGIPTEVANPTKGFNDPNGIYPLRIGEPDVNRLARSGIDHIVESGLQGEAATDVPIALSSTKWSSPPYENNAVYPFNHVYETESGHIQEYDDTPENERSLDMHRSGTHQYIDNDGNRVSKVKKNNYEIIADDNSVYISGNCNVTIDGNYNLMIKGDMNLQVDGDINVLAGKELDVNQTGSGARFKFGGNLDQTIVGTRATTVNGESDETINGKSDITYNGPNHVRFNDDKHQWIGKDTYSRHDEGIDYSCPADPSRTSDIDCDDVDFATGALSATSFTRGIGDVNFNNPFHPKNSRALLEAIYPNVTPSIIEVATATILDAPEETETEVNTQFICNSFQATLSDSDYSTLLSPNYTLASLSTQALFPHKITAQNGLTEGQIACNLQLLAINVLEPIRGLYGTSFTVNSGFRQRKNGRSDHEYGQAVDIQFPGFTRAQTLEVAKEIKELLPSYKQLIFENLGNAGGWIHIAYAGSRGTNDKIILSTNDGRSYRSGLLLA